MKKLLPLSMLVLLLAVVVYSCKKDDENDPSPNPPSSGSELWGNVVTATVYGRVMDVNDNPVSGAIVKGGAVTTTTDAQGVFRLNGIAAYKRLGYIRVEKSGYFLGSRSFVPVSGGNRVNIRLLPNTPAGNVNAAQGGTVTVQGAEVTLPANGVVKNNVPYTGTVRISLRHIDPVSDNFSEEMPGNLIGVQNNQSRGLISYGMVAAELTDNNGQPLQIAQGQTATVKFAIPAQQQSSAPATIDLWSFDEVKGYWKHEGTATKQGNEYIAQVSHFSFWNCDIPGEWITLQGTITNTGGQPLQGATVTLNSQTIGAAADYTNVQGQFGGWVPSGQTLTMTVQVPCGSTSTTVLTQNIGPFSTNTTLNPIAVTIPGATQVTGTLVDCNNASIVSGYVIASGQVHLTSSSGQFSFSACGSSVTLTPYSTGPLSAGTAQTINLTGGTQNVGNLQVCSGGGGTGSVTDIDGNTYATIQIGSQEWMQENLKTTKYRNGDLIPTGLNNTQWQNTTSGAWAYYNDSSQYNNPYGKLYNWYAVADPRALCPTGWHVPTDSEWNQLVKFLDPQADTTCANCYQSPIAGGLMKSVGNLQLGTGLWQPPNTGATNASSFSSLPGGFRLYNGFYYYLGLYGHWWSSSPSSTSNAWDRRLDFNNGDVFRNNTDKPDGYSVRCLKD